MFAALIIVSLTIPFALLFASICLDLRHIPANLLSLGALDFRHGGRRRSGHGGEHRAPPGPQARRQHQPHVNRFARLRTKCSAPFSTPIGIIVTAYLPIFTLAGSGRPIVQAHGLDSGVCLAWAH